MSQDPVDRAATVYPEALAGQGFASKANPTFQPEEAVTVSHEGVLGDEEQRPAASEYLEILSTLGSGGMGDVHLARDMDLGRVVALKVIGADISRSTSLTARFLTEAQVTAQLEHPHIVPVYRLERTEEGAPAFSMKLIRGITLKRVLELCQEGRGPELSERLEAFVSVCDAMAYAHEKGVVHRDLKPENIMVGTHGEVYVVDWGVARLLGHDDDEEADETPEPDDELSLSYASHVTRPGSLLGTPAYMSPEQASAEPCDAASDQYTLGLILQEITTLERANPSDKQLVAISHAAEAKRHPMGGSRDLRAIVDRATQRAPADRYPSVEALAADVRRYMRGDAIAARPDGPLRKLWRWTRRHPVPTLTVLGLLLAAAAGVTIVSLLTVVVVQEQSAADQRRRGEQVSVVSRRSHAIDTEMLRYQALLDGVAQRAMRDWARTDEPEPVPLYDRAAYRDGPAPADYGPSTHYRMDVSFTDPLVLFAPGVDEAQAEGDARRLLDLRSDFRTAFLRAHDEHAVTLPDAEQDALLRDKGVPPAWVYVGLRSGVLLNYPGHPNLSDTFDPRKRPWYTSTEGTHGPRWGVPYQGDSGYSILVPCNRALYDDQGQLFGVAGLDVTLDTVIEMMDLDLPGVTETWLVDASGNVIVSSAQAGLNLGAGLHDNRALGTQPFPDPAVHAAIAAGAPFGDHVVDGGIVIFDRMDALGLTYAVRIDE